MRISSAPFGQLYSSPYMNAPSYQNERTSSSFTNDISMMSLESGSHISAPNVMLNYGQPSSNICKNGMAFSGNSPQYPIHAISWI
jgi:hypothetical protein